MHKTTINKQINGENDATVYNRTDEEFEYNDVTNREGGKCHPMFHSENVTCSAGIRLLPHDTGQV